MDIKNKNFVSYNLKNYNIFNKLNKTLVNITIIQKYNDIRDIDITPFIPIKPRPTKSTFKRLEPDDFDTLNKYLDNIIICEEYIKMNEENIRSAIEDDDIVIYQTKIEKAFIKLTTLIWGMGNDKFYKSIEEKKFILQKKIING